MKTTLTSRMFALTAAVSALTGIGQAAAQDFTFEWNPRTGDAWVDNWLDDVNRYGSRYRQPFVDEMVRYHGAPRELVDALLAERQWAPGDVYYACAIARIIGRPCRYVVDEWERDHAQGWGAVAQRLGITPGSAEFHRIKRGFVPTYDRWGRPIRIDEDLYRYYPERARAMQTLQSVRGGSGAGPKGKADDRGNKPAAKPPAGNGGRKATGNKVDDRKTGGGKATGGNR